MVKLEEAGFVRLESGELAGITFSFEHILERRETLDLVVVDVSVSPTESPDWVSQLEGLARTLDAIGSFRSLTAVVIGHRPGAQLIRRLSRSARFLWIDGSDVDQDESILDALSVLMPLHIAERSEQTSNSEWLDAKSVFTTEHPLEGSLIFQAAQKNPEAVRRAAVELLGSPLAEAQDG